ncbi:hypothetical protein LIER_16911 [Lithospermum erythrorhizon]|uniref:Uncharacterized protein n=1 Tax=Lithospermum erythrorhizon TaxID=34254 RepID=A0AAV3Q8P3_LITER
MASGIGLGKLNELFNVTPRGGAQGWRGKYFDTSKPCSRLMNEDIKRVVFEMPSDKSSAPDVMGGVDDVFSFLCVLRLLNEWCTKGFY